MTKGRNEADTASTDETDSKQTLSFQILVDLLVDDVACGVLIFLLQTSVRRVQC